MVKRLIKPTKTEGERRKERDMFPKGFRFRTAIPEHRVTLARRICRVSHLGISRLMASGGLDGAVAAAVAAA